VISSLSNKDGLITLRSIGARVMVSKPSISRSAVPHQHEVFDADAVAACLVIAGLVRDDHGGQQRLPVWRLRDALRSFMDAEIAADPVPGAVVTVEPLLAASLASSNLRKLTVRRARDPSLSNPKNA